MAKTISLPFENDICEMENLLSNLETRSGKNHPAEEEIRRIRKELVALKRLRYGNLSAWETVMVSRHSDRPQFMDYSRLAFEDFTELHGDRALRCGLVRIGETKLMLMGHQKGKTLAERRECMYGCAHPEGYRKAIRCMKFAEKFKLPVVCLIDTPGAFPGIGSEERGIAQLIADALKEMALLDTPIICVVIGEGGSGGALGIGIGDRIAMLEHSYYSVISPEGCAGILWKTANEETKPKAAEALRLTSKHCMKLRVIDEVLPEPLGGAHRDHKEMAGTMKAFILRSIRELKQLKGGLLVEKRYEKFRRMGEFLETTV